MGKIISDSTWKSNYGPILSAELYNGEEYDANLEIEGWSTSKVHGSFLE